MPTEKKTTRKLRAILSADVKGYSILMADDETFTIKTLKNYRSIMSTLIQEHNGRVVDAPGDNLLADFSSVVDAVECAVEIQRRLRNENNRVKDDKKLQYRIGVNIGDVVQDGDRIYGSGVNVAARIEGLAEPGGICISRNAYDQIKDKLNIGYEYLGDHKVKNIKDPVRVYKILTDPEDAGKLIGVAQKSVAKNWRRATVVLSVIVIIATTVLVYDKKRTEPEFEPAKVEEMAYTLPDKPSIAVLPFNNMSGDPENDHIADGLTEDIITSISKTDQIFVIARNSTFTYKGKPVKIKQISEEFGVQYVLEGSIQNFGERLQITAQLIDALTGRHLWADRYNRKMVDFFNVRDEIIKKILVEIVVKMAAGEQARLSARQTNNLEAWILYMKGLQLIDIADNRETNYNARKYFEEAIKIDPDFVNALAWIGYTHFNEYAWDWSENRSESRNLYFDYTQRALSINRSQPISHFLLANSYFLQGEIEKSTEEVEKAIALEPNNPDYYYLLAYCMHRSGHHEEAVNFLMKAKRLNPFYPDKYLFQHAKYLHCVGRYEEALTAYTQFIERKDKNGEFFPSSVNQGLTATYLELGKIDYAYNSFKDALAVDPTICFIGWARDYLCYKDNRLEHLVRLFEPLRTLYGDSDKRVQYVYNEQPSFKFEYPEESKIERIRKPEKVVDITTRGADIVVRIKDIPEGIKIEEIGSKHYYPLLKAAGIGSKFNIISDEMVTLRDGTEACRTEIEWLWGGVNKMNTFVVATYVGNNLVIMDATSWCEDIHWVAESLTFE